MQNAQHHNSPRPANIAIVEDDADQSASMVEYLAMLGHTVWAEAEATGFYRRLVTNPVDVVVLDIGLPGEDGLSIARHVVETGIGIIIVSARSRLDDRLAGLDAGADIYLTKPVDLLELAAHIDALQRRLSNDNRTPPSHTFLNKPAWQLLRERRQLLTPDGELVDLTPSEYSFMECLVAGDGETSRHAIAEALVDDPSSFNFHRIDVLMSRLRKKVRSQTGYTLPLTTAPRQRLKLTTQLTAD